MTIRVRDVMNTKLETVTPRMSLRDLEHALLAHRVSGFPVVDDGVLVGVVSRSDVVRTLEIEHAWEEQISDYYRASDVVDPEAERASIGARVGAQLEHRTVADAMVQAVQTVAPDASVTEAAGRMVEHGIHRLPVVEGDKLVGIVSSLDLVDLIAAGHLSDTA